MKHPFLVVGAVAMITLVGCHRIVSSSKSAWDYSDLAKGEYEAGDLASAKKNLLEAIKLDPKEPDFHNTLGSIYYDERDQQGARDEFRKALDILKQSKNPDSTQTAAAYSNLTALDIRMKDYASAETDGLAAAKANPSDPHAFNNLGLAEHKLKKYSLAIMAFKKAIQLDPQNMVAYLNMGAAYYRSGQADAARRAWNYALEHGNEGQKAEAKDYIAHPETS